MAVNRSTAVAGHSAALIIPASRRQEPEDTEFEASVGYMSRCWGRGGENKDKGSKGGMEEEI